MVFIIGGACHNVPLHSTIFLVTMGGNLSFPEVDLKDKVAIVTGGNAGIGYETAKGIARLGARTIIACRSEEKATAVSA